MMVMSSLCEQCGSSSQNLEPRRQQNDDTLWLCPICRNFDKSSDIYTALKAPEDSPEFQELKERVKRKPGRKPGSVKPPEEKHVRIFPTIRADQLAKYEKLGGSGWLQKMIDEANV